jgi:prepilin-type N-terminal cleavage/methylation domain-containing protein
MDRMSRRGFTLVELLLASALGAVVLLSLGSFFLSMIKAYSHGNDQVFLQRQATLIQDELARQILPASHVATGPCAGGTAATNSLLASFSSGTHRCFYQQGDEMFECEIANPTNPNSCVQGTTRNLVKGPPTSLRASNVVFQREAGGSAVAITFELQDAKGLLKPVSFGMRVTVRN